MIVGCALLFFVASVIWYLNRSVTVTLNGSDTSIHINATRGSTSRATRATCLP